MKTLPSELIKITSIKIFKSNICIAEDYMNNQAKTDEVAINVELNTACNIDANNTKVRLNIELTPIANDDETIGVIGEFVFEFILHIDNLEDFIFEKDGKRLIEKKMGATINGIVYSTARGIIYERTLSTPFGGLILPVVDPKLLVEKLSN